jgi:hypothetical protein
MVHELLTIKHNTVDMKGVLGDKVSKEMQEIILSSDDDTFFSEVMY